MAAIYPTKFMPVGKRHVFSSADRSSERRARSTSSRFTGSIFNPSRSPQCTIGIGTTPRTRGATARFGEGCGVEDNPCTRNMSGLHHEEGSKTIIERLQMSSARHLSRTNVFAKKRGTDENNVCTWLPLSVGHRPRDKLPISSLSSVRVLLVAGYRRGAHPHWQMRWYCRSPYTCCGCVCCFCCYRFPRTPERASTSSPGRCGSARRRVQRVLVEH